MVLEEVVTLEPNLWLDLWRLWCEWRTKEVLRDVAPPGCLIFREEGHHSADRTARRPYCRGLQHRAAALVLHLVAAEWIRHSAALYLEQRSGGMLLGAIGGSDTTLRLGKSSFGGTGARGTGGGL